MGSSPLMDLGIKAMSANFAAIQTTGNNIANANVAGYSRQQVQLQTAPGQYTGAGFFGRGVDVATITRAHDDFLTTAAVDAKSLSSMDAARLAQLQGLQNLFPTDQTGLGYAATQLFTAMTDVASHPGDASSRQVVLARANDLANNFASVGAGLDNVQAGVAAQLQTSVASVNTLAQNIADVNQQIAKLQGQGQPPNDLLDQRDQLISQLAQQVKVTRVDASDGSVSLFIGGGQSLVLGAHTTPLKLVQDPSDPTRSAVAVMDGSGPRPVDSAALGGGSIAGLLNFQNQDLAQARNLVGQLAASVAGAVNAQQGLGLTLRPPLGSASGPALFSVGPPLALANAANAKDAAGNPIGSVSLAVTDPSALQASDYDLRPSTSSPGSWQLTRLSDGQVSTVTSGSVVDGMRITLTNPQPGDRFLLQPVAHAANGMASLLTDPRDVAAASPLTATTAAANTGTAAVSALQVSASPAPTPGATAQISFTDNAGSYSWQLNSSGGALLASGSGVWQAGQPLPPPGQNINGFSLQLSGVPRAGDAITVAPTAANALTTNNGNALAFAALQTQPMVAGGTVGDRWSQALADIGVRVQSAKASADMAASAASQAEQARSSQAGVNLDEEAAKLIQYQQSYQAAAKVLQVAQTLFTTLLQTAGA
ncbi:MAG: flagellar hook-associated protein FlgK [Burkholderiales bacterium]|nr:flagellar hook-associated protein FlgK [Burkholderiales bacterium]